MNPSRLRWLCEKSFERDFIFRSCLIIVAIGLVLARMIAFASQSSGIPKVHFAFATLGGIIPKQISQTYFDAVRTGDWGTVILMHPLLHFRDLCFASVILAGVVALIWGSVFVRVRQTSSPYTFAMWGLVALVLGALSTMPTVIAYSWMDQNLPFEESESFLPTLGFFVFSVGFREELFKLLFFLPLIPFIRRKGRSIDALLLAAFVGLGFAVEENLSYFSNVTAANAARIFSANMLHFSLTGVIGLYVYRAVLDPKKNGVEALTVFLLGVGVHGLYDTLLTLPLPVLNDEYITGFLAIIVLILVCSFFFQLLSQYMEPTRTQGVSITATFFWGVSYLVVLETIALCISTPWGYAVGMVWQSALSTIIVCATFTSRLKEPIRS